MEENSKILKDLIQVVNQNIDAKYYNNRILKSTIAHLKKINQSKQCLKCSIMKIPSKFNDGHSVCTSCVSKSEYAKAYYQKTKELKLKNQPNKNIEN